jgi:NADH-quinone oxidoreductase subunit E
MTDDKEKTMSIFPIPTDLGSDAMMKNASAMTSWMKDGEAGLMPMAVQSAGAAVMAASFGMAAATHMTGMMFGLYQGMIEASMRQGGAAMPTEPAAKPAARTAKKAPAAAKTTIETGADVVPMEPAEPAPAKARATVEKLKSDASEAAAAARETSDTAAAKAERASESLTGHLEPEDFRRPAEIEKPALPDDLKMISGVGPKLEQVLNGLGVWTFGQISAWTAEEIAWVDDYLQFKGRIERDDWIRQSAALAAGGREEYVRVFGKEPR